MSYKKVVLIGGGVLGSQIAYQSAYCGFDVTIWLRSEASIGRAKPKVETLYETYKTELARMNSDQAKVPGVWCNGLADKEHFDYDACLVQNERAHAELKYETDLAKALKDADLVIEALAEDPQQKIDFYKKAAPLMEEKTVLVTNSSTLLPSTFAEVTGRPEKYLSLHFANNIWRGNTAEIMNHAGTDQRYYDEVVEFAKEIRMVPLCLHKEQPGYILNTMLVPFLSAAQYLWGEDISDPETIDLTWKIATGAPMGPFEILDMVGVTTAYNIVSMHPEANVEGSSQNKIKMKLEAMIKENKLGRATGEGFYKY